MADSGHFLAISDQYSTFILFVFFHKMPENLDNRKLPSIAFLAIYFRSIRNFFVIDFFSKWTPAAILDAQFLPKSIWTSLYSRSVATSNMKLYSAFLIKLWSAHAFSSYFHKMAAGSLFGFPIFSKIDRVLPL